MQRIRRLVIWCGSLALTLGAFVGVAGAQDKGRPVSFAGKQIKVFIGFSPTGIGYDTYGRMLARHIVKHLPGNPSSVANNMPGAGSLKLANYMFHVAAKDGTEIAVIGRGNAMDRLIKGDKSGAKFDARNFNWIGSMNNEVAGFFIRDGAPAKDINDIIAGKELKLGAAGAGSDGTMFSYAINSLLGANLRVIAGFPGMNEILLAMDRGEMDGVAGYSWSTARVGSKDKIESGKYKIVMQLSMSKHPDLPKVPLIADFAKKPEDQQVLKLIFSRQLMGRPVVAPPGVDPAIVETLRKAFDATLVDKEFLADCNKIGLEINYVSGKEVQGLVASLFDLPSEIVQRARMMVGQ